MKTKVEFKGHAAPWVAGEDWDENDRYVIYSDEGIQPHICYTPEWSIGDEKAEANAKLIAAAPELLEAAIKAIKKESFWWIDLQAAINKALGE